MKKRISSLLAALMMLGWVGSASADDIDIYYNTDFSVDGAEPMVMFSLDWRPNLGSTACGGGECQFLIDEGYLPVQADYTYFDMLRGVLRKVMDPLDGLRVGLMLNHDYKNNCAGRVTAGCSNGGYIGLGFELFEAGDTNGAKDQFHTFLDNIPTPQGNASHKYQGKELFFELFRYLTGQGVLNGHVGYLDYNGYPESGFYTGGTGDDGGSDGGDPITVEVCEAVRIKGKDTPVCADVTYDPSTQEYSCAVEKKGSDYALVCPVTDLDVVVEPDPDPVVTGGDKTNLDVDNPSISWDTSIEDGDTYISPLDSGGRCSKIFTVNIMFQVSQQEADSDAFIEASKVSGGTGVSMKEFPDMIQYLNDADLGDGTYGTAADLEGEQNVTSYFIVDETKINTTTRGYATAGGTGTPLALTEDPEELVETLEDVFKQILSVSTTFVSASVPVNAFNRSEVIDNIYLALFKTDPDGKPIWTGNVKKLKYSAISGGGGEAQIEDARGDQAVAADGRIAYSALTYWTDGGSLPAADPDENEVAGADGRSTTRGGAGQKIPGVISGSVGEANSDGGRNLFFEAYGDLYALDADATTASFLAGDIGVDDTEALELIKYARGMDVADQDGDGNTTETRDWIMGDPLHSRPMPINYGSLGSYSEDNQAIYVAFGANDGYMRMIKNTTTSGVESGEEVWAFMPREVMDKLPTLRDNAAGEGHPYLVDGSPSVYIEEGYIDGALDNQDIFMYFGLRRGGKALYGMDISEPEDPEFLWKITKGGDFAELGYTFSDPVVGRISDGSGGLKPVVIFGGGYDLNKDTRGTVGTDDSEGAAIYVVDGETGELIWKTVGTGSSSSSVFVHSDMVNSIPSKVSAVDTNGDQITDRIYVGDTGGRVWRADIGNDDTSTWKTTKLAELGRHWNNTKLADRRFFHAPSVVQAKDGSGPFDAVVIGSGDRADPLQAGGAVRNFVYMIKDRNIAVGGGQNTSLTQTSFGDVSNTCLTVGGECTANLANGWRMSLTERGEASLATPLTFNGTVYFTTYLRPGTSDEERCGPDEGSGRLYAVSLQSASAVRDYDSTTEELERFDDLDSKGIPSEVVYIPPVKDTCQGEGCPVVEKTEACIMNPGLECDTAGGGNRLATYWLELEDESL